MSTFSQELPRRAVVIFLIHEDEVLLTKKLSKIGQGLWNGYGGKIEPGETDLECALRELSEESGIVLAASDLEEMGHIDCRTYIDLEGTSLQSSMIVTLFIAKLSRRPRARASAETGEPQWFPVTELPYREMIPTDLDWMPDIFAGRKIYASIHLGPGQRTRVSPTAIVPLEQPE